jgi:hypothetical protein
MASLVLSAINVIIPVSVSKPHKLHPHNESKIRVVTSHLGRC